jgi:hypothetical protein
MASGCSLFLQAQAHAGQILTMCQRQSISYCLYVISDGNDIWLILTIFPNAASLGYMIVD